MYPSVRHFLNATAFTELDLDVGVKFSDEAESTSLDSASDAIHGFYSNVVTNPKCGHGDYNGGKNTSVDNYVNFLPSLLNPVDCLFFRLPLLQLLCDCASVLQILKLSSCGKIGFSHGRRNYAPVLKPCKNFE